MKRLLMINILLSALALTACHRAQPQFSGYVEPNLRYLASSQSGYLSSLNVKRGQCVQKGQLLFQIDRQPYSDQLVSAQAALLQAQADLNNALTGDRPSELAEIQAQIAQAKAQLAYANKQLARNRALEKVNSAAEQDVDKADRNAVASYYQLKNLEAKLATAKLPEREQLIKAAQATVAEAKANLEAAQWTLNQTSVKSPVSACIFDNYYWQGEQVPANQPVVSLLVPDDERVVFYIPEQQLASLHIGDTIQFVADGTQATGKAIVRFISPQAEYTPPVIYSNHERQKLVYRVEAAFQQADMAKQWHPGQILTIHFVTARHGKADAQS